MSAREVYDPMRAHVPATIIFAAAALAVLVTCGAFSVRRAGRAAHVVADEQPPPAAAFVTISSASAADSDSDGIPNQIELTRAADRENFRRWFTYIAEKQFYHASESWHAEQRDCAGLVRFAWREALRRHDRLWLKRMGAEYDSVAPDVAAYTLDRAPYGEQLFRTRAGSVDASNDAAADSFAEFADARTLRDYNARFVARDPTAARPGDLLFFHQPWGTRYPHHVMLYVGTSAADADDTIDDWVVYHTGASPGDAGTVKKVRLAALARHPDARWRPINRNPRFLGFYRLKILD